MTVTLTEKPGGGPALWFVGQERGDAGVKTPVFKIVEVTFDSSYPTGGEAIALNTIGFASVVHVLAPSNGGYIFEADVSTPTAPKLLAYQGDWNNGADAPLNEVPDTTDLGTIVTRALVFGYV